MRSQQALLEDIRALGEELVASIDSWHDIHPDATESPCHGVTAERVEALWDEAYEAFILPAIRAGKHDETPLVKALFAVRDGFREVHEGGYVEGKGRKMFSNVWATQMREVLAAMPAPSGQVVRYLVSKRGSLLAVRCQARKDGFKVLEDSPELREAMNYRAILTRRVLHPTAGDAILAAQAANKDYLRRLQEDLSQAMAMETRLATLAAKQREVMA